MFDNVAIAPQEVRHVVGLFGMRLERRNPLSV
jgi:hypothetical protein